MSALQQNDHDFIFKEILSDEIVSIDNNLSVSDPANINDKTATASKRRTRDEGRAQVQNKKVKGITHREIEKQRRLEMTMLYESLRSTLPPHCIKGKRSKVDHMDEAVSYIKSMQETINEMSIKRDKLRQTSNGNILTGSSINLIPNTVIVNPCHGGLVEILINCGFDNQLNVPLSRVLAALLEQGISVINCISTNVNDRLLHTIQSEVSSLIFNNLSTLQEDLIRLLNS